MKFLKPILGDEYETFESAIATWNDKAENKDKQVKIADIGTGQYVSKNKYRALEMVKKSVEAQLSNQMKVTADIQKEYALRDRLKSYGISDPDYIIYKQGGLDKFKFDQNGEPVGMDGILKSYRESSPHLFRTVFETDYNPIVVDIQHLKALGKKIILI